MGLRINTNVAAINTSRILRGSSKALNKSLERLSSGLRINRAADDAAGLAIAEGLRAQVRGTGQAIRNAQDGISLIQTAEGALSEVSNILQRIRELAVQSANGTNSATNRSDLQLEVAQLILQTDAIAANTEFNNITPLSIATTTTLQIGADAGQVLAVTFTGATALLLGFNAVNVGTSAATASAAITTVDASLLTLNTQRATLGAFQNRLESAINTLGTQQENSASAESSIRDADIAVETTAFTRNQILVSAGTSILSQANLTPQTALQLLG